METRNNTMQNANPDNQQKDNAETNESSTADQENQINPVNQQISQIPCAYSNDDNDLPPIYTLPIYTQYFDPNQCIIITNECAQPENCSLQCLDNIPNSLNDCQPTTQTSIPNHGVFNQKKTNVRRRSQNKESQRVCIKKFTALIYFIICFLCLHFSCNTEFENVQKEVEFQESLKMYRVLQIETVNKENIYIRSLYEQKKSSDTVKEQRAKKKDADVYLMKSLIDYLEKKGVIVNKKESHKKPKDASRPVKYQVSSIEYNGTVYDNKKILEIGTKINNKLVTEFKTKGYKETIKVDKNFFESLHLINP